MKSLFINGEKISDIPSSFSTKKDTILKVKYPHCTILPDVSKIDSEFLHLSVSPATIKIDKIFNSDEINIDIESEQFKQFILDLDKYQWILTGFFMSTEKPELLMIYKHENKE